MEKAYLKNVVNPREVVVFDDDDYDNDREGREEGRRMSSTSASASLRDSKKSSKRAHVGPDARSIGSIAKPRSKMGKSASTTRRWVV